MVSRRPAVPRLQITLNALSKTENGVTWIRRDKAIIVTIRSVGSPSIASTDLPGMQVRVRTLSEATDELLQQPTMKSCLSQLKMAAAPDNGGFSSIVERETRSIVVPAGTLRDQLNTLAITFDTLYGAWISENAVAQAAFEYLGWRNKQGTYQRLHNLPCDAPVTGAWRTQAYWRVIERN